MRGARLLTTARQCLCVYGSRATTPCRVRATMLTPTTSGARVPPASATLHTTAPHAKKRRTVRKQIVYGKQASTKEPVDFYDKMTLAEASFALEDTTTNVADLLRRLDPLANEKLYEDNEVIDRGPLLQLAGAYNYRPRFVPRSSDAKVLAQLEKEAEDVYPQPLPPASQLEPRAPVVTIMGHVDHGKTTLLDALRNSRIVASEFGGITQHIGAFSASLSRSNARVTFLDTPGHAAFRSMRERGAQATDIVVLVVAADDGAKDQTVESIRYANEANVPIVVALNKCDKPEADPERAKRSLMEHNIVVEGMGGDVQVVEISALQGTNLDALQEALIMQAELMELRSTPHGAVEGIVIEATTAQGLGKVCTMIVRRGTLRKGAFLISGTVWGRVRTMHDEYGKQLDAAGPSTPVRIAGWRDELPSPGAVILEVAEGGEARANRIAAFRAEVDQQKKAEEMQGEIDEKRAVERQIYLDNLSEKYSRGQRYGSTLRHVQHRKQRYVRDTGEDARPTVRLLLRTDVDGTLEAIQQVLATYADAAVNLLIVDAAVGSPSDDIVEIAAEFKACIYCFNTPLSASVQALARARGVDIEQFNVIYRLVDALKRRLDDTYGPISELKLVGEGHVLKEFLIADANRKRQPIAGTQVDWGIMKRAHTYRFMRKGEAYFEGSVESLKQEAAFVAEASTNTEVGIALNDKAVRFKPDDVVEAFELVTVNRHVRWQPPGF